MSDGGGATGVGSSLRSVCAIGAPYPADDVAEQPRHHGLMTTHDELAAVWRGFVAAEAARYSPLYTAIVEAAAADEELLALVTSAPRASHYPLVLLAAVHDLVLAGELPELAAVYRGDGPVDASFPLLRAAVLDRRDHVQGVLHERFIQTNECGRAAPLALGIAAVTAAVGQPDALVDAGASAGLNLLYDRYRLEVGEHGVWGDRGSPVVSSCVVQGKPLPSLRLVDVPVRIGLDRAPVDITDPNAARWLLASTWPDTGRLERTRAAVELAALSPPDVRTGDLVSGIGPLVDELDGEGPVCVVTSWAVAYLAGSGRKGFVEALARAGSQRTIAWLSLEAPGVVRGIDVPTAPTMTFTAGPSLVGLTTFGPGGIESQRALAYVHPHGSTLEWIGPERRAGPGRGRRRTPRQPRPGG